MTDLEREAIRATLYMEAKEALRAYLGEYLDDEDGVDDLVEELAEKLDEATYAAEAIREAG